MVFVELITKSTLFQYQLHLLDNHDEIINDNQFTSDKIKKFKKIANSPTNLYR